MTTKRVLAIHDLCSFGRCSLTAAIPVISAMGFQVCPFPTAIFSNNLTYGDFTFSDFTPHMTEFMDKWQKLGYEYDAIYSGFLADAGQIEVVSDAISRFAKEDSLIVVDPAMGDNGNLYPVFTPAIVPEMRKLIAKATVITPNYTEACLLAGIPYSEDLPKTTEMLDLCKTLSDMGPKKSRHHQCRQRFRYHQKSSVTIRRRPPSTNTRSAASPSAPVERATSLPVFLPAPCSKGRCSMQPSNRLPTS